jgi:hypothetical protein
MVFDAVADGELSTPDELNAEILKYQVAGVSPETI